MTATHAAHRPRRRLAAVLALFSALALLALTPAAALAAGDANEAGCPPQTEGSPGFRSYLPDCRAYELVTPPYTEGAPVSPVAISGDATHLIGHSLGVFGGAESAEAAGDGSYYEFTRTPLGWSTVPIDPPSSDSRFGIFEYLAAGADLSTTLWEASPSPPAEERTASFDLYRREEGPAGEPRFTEIGPRDYTEGAGHGETGHSPARLAGASPDLGHLLLSIESGPHLWPGDTTTAGRSLYEYDGPGNPEPRLVGVSNVGPLNGSPHLNEGADLISRCATELGSGEGGDTYNAISQSGDTVFFTAVHAEGCASPPVNELYARVNGSSTLAISEPLLPAGEQCTGACASAPRSEGVFQGASSDGSKVFFLTTQPLINNDTDSTQDLYEAELKDGALTRLTLISEGETHAAPAEDDPTPGAAANVLGVVRVSQDGSRVYFVAQGVLTRAPNSEGAVAAAGERNLYVFDTLTGRTAFLATLQSEPQEATALSTCEALDHLQCSNLAPWNLMIWRAEDYRAAQATPDGRFLAFPSLAHLTSDDSSGPLVPQLFLYDASTATLARVSIGEGAAADDGNTTEPLDAPLLERAYYGPDARPTSTASSLALTSAGAVLFESADGLLPQAQTGAPSVYEYRDGHVYLISDGQDPRRAPPACSPPAPRAPMCSSRPRTRSSRRRPTRRRAGMTPAPAAASPHPPRRRSANRGPVRVRGASPRRSPAPPAPHTARGRTSRPRPWRDPSRSPAPRGSPGRSAPAAS